MTRFASIVTSKKPTSVKPVGSGKSGALKVQWGNSVAAIVKVSKTKMPKGQSRQRGIFVKDHPYREVAFYELARLLKCADIVPETVMFTFDGAPASAQRLVPAITLLDIDSTLAKTDSEKWLNRFKAVVRRTFSSADLQKLVLLDLVTAARDRHATNVGATLLLTGKKPSYKLVAWDNACTFGPTFARYSNVFHEHIYKNAISFSAHWRRLEGITWPHVRETLKGLLPGKEVEHTYRRLQFLLEYPYRLPFAVLSQGSRTDEFPAYSEYFVDVEMDYALPVPFALAR